MELGPERSREAGIGGAAGGFAIRSPGLLTTVQDGGRYGRQHLGVPVAGPMDAVSYRVANAAVGNSPSSAALEVTLVGPEIEFRQAARFAVSGAAFPLQLAGASIPSDAPALAAAGQRLTFGQRRRGARAYLAVAGGVAVPAVLGSRATHLGSRTGGLDGRALRAGDLLPIGTAGRMELLPRRFRSPLALPDGGARVRVVLGPHDAHFEPRVVDSFLTTRYFVTPQSDRMGYRLRGALLPRRTDGHLLSTATPFGAVQVPPGGEPIVLMADRQTAGGYPRIGTVITADLPLVGQLAPGDWIEFEACDQATALRALVRLERALLALERDG